MKTINFKNKKIKIYNDLLEFARMKEKPLGEIPEGAQYNEEENNHSTGFASIDKNCIWLYVPKECNFEDLLETVSHELGHLIEGGFKKNPPQKDRYFQMHEEKAEHYQKFVMDSFKLTKKFFYESTKKTKDN